MSLNVRKGVMEEKRIDRTKYSLIAFMKPFISVESFYNPIVYYIHVLCRASNKHDVAKMFLSMRILNISISTRKLCFKGLNLEVLTFATTSLESSYT